MSRTTIVRHLLHVFLAAAFVVVAKPAAGQYGMDFSIYTDIAFDGTTVYGWADGYDNSWGCQHSDYTGFGYLASPTRYVSGSNYLSLPFDDDDGVWAMDGGYSFLCSCLFNYAQASNQIQVPVNRIPTFVRRIGTQQYQQGPPAPYAFVVNREILDQFGAPINAVMFVNESFDPDPPSGNCTSEEVEQGDGNSTEGGTFGPDFYTLPGNAPNPCESTSTQRFQITYKGYPYTVFTRYTVTWRYSGITLEPIQEP